MYSVQLLYGTRRGLVGWLQLFLLFLCSELVGKWTHLVGKEAASDSIIEQIFKLVATAKSGDLNVRRVCVCAIFFLRFIQCPVGIHNGFFLLISCNDVKRVYLS